MSNGAIHVTKIERDPDDAPSFHVYFSKPVRLRDMLSDSWWAEIGNGCDELDAFKWALALIDEHNKKEGAN